jgi:diguanylate cyclase (GGDEF)-like protein/PAS domain S-box-containing protein
LKTPSYDRDNEARFRALLDSSRDASLIFNDADALIEANSLACELLGKPWEEIAGQSWSALLSMLSDDAGWATFAGADRFASFFTREGALYEIETRFLSDSPPDFRLRTLRRREESDLALLSKLKAAFSEGDLYKTLLDNLSDGVYVVDRDRRINYWNRGAEAISGRSPEEITGRFCQDNLLKHINEAGIELCKNGCPLLATIKDGAARSAEVSLLHKDGHRVPVFVRTSPIRDSDGEIIGAIETFQDNTEKFVYRRKIEELERLALIDPLTGLPNRRCLDKRLEETRDEWERTGRTFGVLFCDIDNFKDVNDRYGHETGDEMLKLVGRTLLSNFRLYDVVGRWGGEEFIAVVSNVTEEKLMRIARRLKVLVNHSSLRVEDRVLSVTLSIGATICREDESESELIERADQLMYQSKERGRDRITFSL